MLLSSETEITEFDRNISAFLKDGTIKKFDGSNNIYYYLRTLESDDIANKATASSIN